ncbi:monofunctional biosynthetic peptidoglycan transglycosylase [Azorhizobium oxalatiphilum]|uniref:Biosynthetic peptidoglycan transglycosylase n=2 Tax=Azorhizobium oxalatiphilum TaxID=980631 RepID=A0A917CA81_9HYPH|nr:monofunctional biosynthetic peptidoglycan transglycosylase [Azorhizobium oxalatiphilum]
MARRGKMRVLRIVVRVAIVLVLAPLVLSVLYNFINPVSTLMLGRWLTGERVERIWTPIDRISPTLVRTVIASEDARFCRHWGVDLEEIRAAIEKADDEIGEARGASTITMQVAKNLFLWNSRSFIRKGLEMPLALWIDLVIPKRRLMEIYLNIAEWGPDGEFGIEAGARRAFRKSAAQLTASESALMAVMLPNPIRRDAGRPGPGVRRLAGNLGVRVDREGPEIVSCLGLGR